MHGELERHGQSVWETPEEGFLRNLGQEVLGGSVEAHKAQSMPPASLTACSDRLGRADPVRI